MRTRRRSNVIITSYDYADTGALARTVTAEYTLGGKLIGEPVAVTYTAPNTATVTDVPHKANRVLQALKGVMLYALGAVKAYAQVTGDLISIAFDYGREAVRYAICPVLSRMFGKDVFVTA